MERQLVCFQKNLFVFKKLGEREKLEEREDKMIVFKEINKLLKKTNSTPIELLEWAERAAKLKPYHLPCLLLPFKGRYTFGNILVFKETKDKIRVAKIINSSRKQDIYSFWRKFCEDKEFRDAITEEYKKHYNLK